MARTVNIIKSKSEYIKMSPHLRGLLLKEGATQAD